jgi:hypothetical protein
MARRNTMSTQTDFLKELIAKRIQEHGKADPTAKLFQQQLERILAMPPLPEEGPEEETYFGRVAIKPRKGKKSKTSS